MKVHVQTQKPGEAPGYDAPLPAEPKPPNVGRFNLRNEAMGLWSLTRFCQSNIHKGFSKLRDAETLFYYGIEVTSGRRKLPVDVPAMIAAWKDCVLVLCTAHSKDDIDAAEFRMDELLKPMLTAPVAQLREFYAGLMEALANDKRVPFFIWSLFKGWGTMVIEKAYGPSKTPPRRLKRKLAEQVAQLAMTKQTRSDLVGALVGALMWRSPEALQEMKADLKAGATPRVRGRESCIFLVTEGKKATHRREIML